MGEARWFGLIQTQNRRGLSDSKLLSFASPKESSQRKGDFFGLPFFARQER